MIGDSGSSRSAGCLFLWTRICSSCDHEVQGSIPAPCLGTLHLISISFFRMGALLPVDRRSPPHPRAESCPWNPATLYLLHRLLTYVLWCQLTFCSCIPQCCALRCIVGMSSCSSLGCLAYVFLDLLTGNLTYQLHLGLWVWPTPNLFYSGVPHWHLILSWLLSRIQKH